MRLEVQKYLFDVREACRRIEDFTTARDFSGYCSDLMLKAAVERQFQIVGEALNQLAKLDPDVAARITDYRRIVAFRNILVHAYAQIDDRVVWGIVEAQVPALVGDVDGLLSD